MEEAWRACDQVHLYSTRGKAREAFTRTALSASIGQVMAERCDRAWRGWRGAGERWKIDDDVLAQAGSLKEETAAVRMRMEI